MEHARPLPPDLLDRYRAWQARRTPEDVAQYAEAAAHGQNPKAMIITCCDSRVLISEIFGNEPGDFFIHRNIANLVPPHEPDGRAHGTSAAIEYAVIALGIEHLVVMGHHGCGGVRGCHDMLAGLAPELDTPTSFVGSWLKILKPGYEALAGRGLDYEARIAALEKEAVLVSLGNLLTFPFVRAAVEEGRLQLHGAWKDIRDGGLEAYDPATAAFLPL
jgi:carbonic anhydrase